MNITIIGATRGIGKEVLNQALENGHQITVLARNPQKIALKNERLKVLKGDFLDYDSLKAAVYKAQAIVVSVGVKPSFKTVHLFSEGSGNLLRSLKESGETPLIITITGIGAGESKGHGGFLYDHFFNPLLLKSIYADKDRQESLLKKEYENWIIVRPGLLTNGKSKEQYRALTDLQGINGGKIARTDVAHFVLEQIESPTFLRQTPLLIY